MMRGEAPWNEKFPSCAIPKEILNRVNNIVQTEMKVEAREKALERVFGVLDQRLSEIVSFMLGSGGAVIRPIYTDALHFEIVPLGRYLPTSYDMEGTLTGAVVLKDFAAEREHYTLTETHEYSALTHSVTSTLYKTTRGEWKEVPLSACPETEKITPHFEWKDCPFPLLVEFRNSTSMMSGVPESIFSGAESLFETADRQFEIMRWEQDAGQLRVFASSDMFRKRQLRNGEVVGVKMTRELNRLVTTLDSPDVEHGGAITTFAPSLRTGSQMEFFDETLRRIETALNIGRGTLSRLETVQQTATQYQGGRNALYCFVDRIEEELESKLNALALVFSYISRAFVGGSDVPEKLTISFNDSETRKDLGASKLEALQEVQNGIMSAFEYRMKFYGEDEKTAKARVPAESVSP